MHQDERQRHAEQVMANGLALVRESRDAVERTRQSFAELGIDPLAEMERLKAQGGDEAMARAQAEVQVLLDQVEQEARRDAMHGLPRGGPGRHTRMRTNRV